jgi:hypothetical protein
MGPKTFSQALFEALVVIPVVAALVVIMACYRLIKGPPDG